MSTCYYCLALYLILSYIGQDFVPFKTTTDAMLASLMLAYRLASPILTVVLALVQHPEFNPAEITMTRAEDVWARVTEHEAEMALQKRNNNSLPFSLPESVVDNIIDVLEADRRAALYDQRDIVEPRLQPIAMSEVLPSYFIYACLWLA